MKGQTKQKAPNASRWAEGNALQLKNFGQMEMQEIF